MIDEDSMGLMSQSPFEKESGEALASRSRQSWKKKFQVAFRGLKLGVRGQDSFFVHFFFTALVVAAAVVLRCGLVQWCLLLGCIGLVLMAELFNSALETLFRGLDKPTQDRVWPCLDISAGAVLVASLAAAVIGCLVFLQQLASLWVSVG